MNNHVRDGIVNDRATQVKASSKGVRNGVLDALRQMELIKCPPAGFRMYHPSHHSMEFGPQCHH